MQNLRQACLIKLSNSREAIKRMQQVVEHPRVLSYIRIGHEQHTSVEFM
jgi:hypothetical protein